MGSGFAKMKKQARMMQQQMESMREEMKKTEVTGTSGNGLVTVAMNGENQLLSITIKPECVDPNDVEGLQDLIKAAFEDAHKKIEQNSDQFGGASLPFS